MSPSSLGNCTPCIIYYICIVIGTIQYCMRDVQTQYWCIYPLGTGLIPTSPCPQSKVTGMYSLESKFWSTWIQIPSGAAHCIFHCPSYSGCIYMLPCLQLFCPCQLEEEVAVVQFSIHVLALHGIHVCAFILSYKLSAHCV